ncbi:MAG TPA: hypothetical protein VHY84_00660 [Bryobacteraceae bacterium]|jgi:hypothetical protein|nr:hypothetical protein [Bryobacteraceae bacterium]
MNALRHGLTARVVVLPTEDMAAYQAFSQEIVDSLHAQTPVERQFAQTIADNQWRINRIRSIEDGMLRIGRYEDTADLDISDPEIRGVMTAARAFRDHSKAFVNLSIYEQRLHRTIKEAFRQLKELKAERREREEKANARELEAQDNREIQQTQDLPSQSAPNGFVYASTKIAADDLSNPRNRPKKPASISPNTTLPPPATPYRTPRDKPHSKLDKETNRDTDSAQAAGSVVREIR